MVIKSKVVECDGVTCLLQPLHGGADEIVTWNRLQHLDHPRVDGKRVM